MKIHAQERIWWSPTLTATDSHGQPVTIPATGWEASFDNGQTWQASRDNSGRPGWLVAGSAFPGPGDTAGIPSDFTMPTSGVVGVLIRHRDTPETVIDASLYLQTA